MRERLLTFSPVNWTGKPRKLSPLVFASHGWICLSSDMVQCVYCGQYMCVSLPKLVSVGIRVYQRVVKYTSCETADIALVKALSKDLINHRYENMENLDLEHITINVPELTPAIIPETVDQKRKALIYFGWQKSEHLDDAVVCTFCGRTVGFWLLEGQLFDVEKQHYYWCVFTSETSRYTTGWQCRSSLLQCLNSPKEIPVLKWAAKADVWKSALKPTSSPDLSQFVEI